MKGVFKLGFAMAAVSALIVTSCEHRSLVAIEVKGTALFDDVTLTVTAGGSETKQFTHATFDDIRVFRIGVYLPADMTGTVALQATADDGLCIRGNGSASAVNVQAGQVTQTVSLTIMPLSGCTPIPDGGVGNDAGGTGKGGAGGGGGSGGSTGSGGGGGNGGSGGTTSAGTGGAGGTTSAGTGGSGGRGGGGGSGGVGGSGGLGGGGGSAGGTGGGGGTGGLGGTGGRGGTGGGGGSVGGGGGSVGGGGGGGGSVGGGGGGGGSTCIPINPCTGYVCGYKTNNCGSTFLCSCNTCYTCEPTSGTCYNSGTVQSGDDGTAAAPPITGAGGGIVCPVQ